MNAAVRTAARAGTRAGVRYAVGQVAVRTGATTPLGPAVLLAVVVAVVVLLLGLIGVFLAASAAGLDRQADPAGTPGTGPAAGAVGLAAAADQAGFGGETLRTAVAVGLAESSGDPSARASNGPTPGCPAGSVDRGGWQINDCYHPEVSDACADDLPCAARAAYRISARGTNWRPWTTYKTGAWRSELATADRAIAALAEGAPSGYGTPGPCGLSPATDYAKHLVTELFGVTDIGGCALGGHIEGSDHYPDANGQAHAIDVMTGTDQALGQRIADWMIANAGPLHVKYVIYNHRIWTPDRGWHPYRHPACRSSSVCSPTLMHEDHVHLSSQLGF